jgi:predicted component of type VI protein secretion system
MTEEEYKIIQQLNDNVMKLSTMFYNLNDDQMNAIDNEKIQEEIMLLVPYFEKALDKIHSPDALKCVADIGSCISNIQNFLS